MSKLKNAIIGGLAALTIGATQAKAQLQPDANTAGLCPPGLPYSVDTNTRALYHLDGNTEDATGVNNGNPATPPYEWVEGSCNLAIKLQDGYVRIPNHPSLNDNLNQLTLEAMVNPDSLIMGGNNDIIRKITRQDAFQYLLRIVDDSLLWFQFQTQNVRSHIIFYDYQFQLGQWYHIAATYDGQFSRLFVNRQMVAESASPPGPINNDSDSELFISTPLGDNNGFYGLIDEVRISNIARDFSTTSVPEGTLEESTWGRIKHTYK